jgi:iron complex transport system substrate-binding protein
MGAGDQLIAVSNYDVEREGITGLPRVGDYQTIDWEQLAALRPDVMLLAQKPDRMPAGVKQRADDLHIRLLNVKVDNLDDIFARLNELGDACNARAKADALAKHMHARLDELRARVASREKVSALLTLEENGLSIAGPQTYLDDLLTIAGGRNAAGTFKTPYPSIDREMLRSLDPQVVVQLLPNASPQMLEKAHQFWESEPNLRAVRDHRVVTIKDWYCLLPGSHTPDVAERIAAALHPDVTAFTKPTP